VSRERWRQAGERSVHGSYIGDGFQMGGTFVFEKDGSIVYDQRSTYYGDDASNKEILTALLRTTLSPEGKAIITAAIDAIPVPDRRGR
jgi:hypothetical protein